MLLQQRVEFLKVTELAAPEIYPESLVGRVSAHAHRDPVVRPIQHHEVAVAVELDVGDILQAALLGAVVLGQVHDRRSVVGQHVDGVSLADDMS